MQFDVHIDRVVIHDHEVRARELGSLRATLAAQLRNAFGAKAADRSSLILEGSDTRGDIGRGSVSGLLVREILARCSRSAGSNCHHDKRPLS
jgi:hypothetical protein